MAAGNRGGLRGGRKRRLQQNTTRNISSTNINSNSCCSSAVVRRQWGTILSVSSLIFLLYYTNISRQNFTSTSLWLVDEEVSSLSSVISNGSTMASSRDGDIVATRRNDNKNESPSSMMFSATTTTNISSDNDEIANTEKKIEQTDQRRMLRLRFDWTKDALFNKEGNLQYHHPLANEIHHHTNNCSLPLASFKYRKRYGLGSDLHVYSQAVCNAIKYGLRIRTVGPWSWGLLPTTNSRNDVDKSKRDDRIRGSPMNGFFDRSELVCPNDLEYALQYEQQFLPAIQQDEEQQKQQDIINNKVTTIMNSPGRLRKTSSASLETTPSMYSIPEFPLSKPSGNIANHCNMTKEDRPEWSRATIEYLFRHTSPELQQEAERQLNLVFAGGGGGGGSGAVVDGDNGEVIDNTNRESSKKNSNQLPKDLITVHIRWGDKVKKYTEGRKKPIFPEMRKVEIDEYIQAIQQILENRRRVQQEPATKFGDKKETANIYLSTEDPAAVQAFRHALPPHWTLYVDQFLVETQNHRVDDYNGHNQLAQSGAMKGKAGLMALGSLLVAMEANDFVLTTSSNFSLLMEELRRSIVDPKCGGCTSIIDILPAKN